MNRFLSKKRLPNGDDASSITSAPKNKEGRRWRKGSKTQEDQRPQVELPIALPTTDDFRTSLIMPNLSARFSMLREQDDPASKIGKASDDSVLSPRRQSRLPDFGFTNTRPGLTDIAEVQSMSSSVRPPWLTNHHDSFVSDDSYGADADSMYNGSIMSRSRPGEGNVLFGGRQKVYKIANTQSTKNLQGSPSMGRLVYEDDVAMSSFQKHKLSEKAAREAEAQRAADEAEASDASSVPFGLASSSTTQSYTAPLPQTTFQQHDTFRSPSLPTDQRQASLDSSTASDGPHDHFSTPATSVASQPHNSPASFAKAKLPSAAPLERSLTKRRLYEQSLDQNMQEQQVSQLTRLNSIQKQRNFSGTKSPPLNHAKSATNLQERAFQPYAVRPQSPTEHLTTFESLGKAGTISPSPPPSGPQSPTFMALNEYDEMNPLSGALQPSDRGKATAMGAFHMPTQQFDEDQYLARLQRLQNSQSPTQEKTAEDTVPASSPQLTRFDSGRQPAKEPLALNTAPSIAAPPPPAEPETQNAFSVFQRAAAQMRSQQPEESDTEPMSPAESVPDTHRTFFGDISASDDDEDDILSDFDRRGYYGSRYRPGGLENIQEYPSGRSQPNGFAEIREEEEEEDYIVPPQPLRTIASKPSLADSGKGQEEPQQLPATTYGVESPVEEQKALGGLIHQHLRNTSNVSSSAPSLGPRDTSVSHFRNNSDQSSIYPSTIGREDSAPSVSDATSRFTRRTYNSENRIESSYTHSNPWDLDEIENNDFYGVPAAKQQYGIPGQRTETQPLAPAPSKANIDSPSSQTTNDSAWQPDHKRELSEGTLLEREAFANELAARQKAIQENLKSIVEVESRGSSPQPSQTGAFKAFNMLKSKTSRDSMVKQQDAAPSKAMKMLGIGAGGSSPNLSLSRKSSVAHEDIRPPTDKLPSFSNSPRPSISQRTPPVGAQKANGMFDMQRPRGDSEASVSGRTIAARPSPPSTAVSQNRTRSNSAASMSRAPSRQERLQGDAGMDAHEPMPTRRPEGSPMAPQGPNAKFSPNFQPNFSPQFAPHFSPHGSPNPSQRPLGSPSERSMQSNGRPPLNNAFDQQAQAGAAAAKERLHAMSNANTPTSATFRPPPPPAVPSPRNVPMPSPYYANPTPPASGHSTPVAFGPSTPTMPNIPNIKQGTSLLRKKTVSKTEISEPILISSTSNVDTVDLPPGASLKNGMEMPPPIPPVNPRRRATKKLFNFSRNGSADELSNSRYPSPRSPPPIPTSAPAGGRMMSPEPFKDHMVDHSYRSASAQSHRPNMRAMRSNESFNSHGYPSPGMPPPGVPPPRPMMTEQNMF